VASAAARDAEDPLRPCVRRRGAGRRDRAELDPERGPALLRHVRAHVRGQRGDAVPARDGLSDPAPVGVEATATLGGEWFLLVSTRARALAGGGRRRGGSDLPRARPEPPPPPTPRPSPPRAPRPPGSRRPARPPPGRVGAPSCVPPAAPSSSA